MSHCLTTMVLGAAPPARHRLSFRNVGQLPGRSFARVQIGEALGAGLVDREGIFAAWLSTGEKSARAFPLFKLLANTSFGVDRVGHSDLLLVSVIIRGMQNVRWRPRLEPFVLAGRMPD